jgi:hypothetical protein
VTGRDRIEARGETYATPSSCDVYSRGEIFLTVDDIVGNVCPRHPYAD